MLRRLASRRSAVFLAFLGAYFLSYFFRSANAVIADDLRTDLNLTPEQLGLMTSLFFATFAAVQLPLGSLLDRFGARWVTPGLMLATVAGSLVFAAAPSFAPLALGRALIGLGMAGVLVGALKAFASWFPPERFATVSSLLVGLGSFGALAAATPLELVTSAVGWRGAFAGGAGVTLLAAALVAAVARAPRPGEGGRPPAAAAPGGFRRIFGSGAFWRIAVMNFATTATLFSYQTLWAGPYLRESLALGPLATGNLLSVLALGATAGYLLLGAVADRIGVPRVVAACALAMIAVQVALALAAPGWPRAPLVALFALFGAGGASSVLFFAHARAVFPATPGRAVTAANLFGIGGSALLQSLLGVLIGALLSAGLSAGVAYRTAFLATAALQALALLLYAPLALQGGGRAAPEGERAA